VRRREFIAVVGAAATWPLTARAQQSDKMRLIGVLLAGEEGDTAGKARLTAFRSALEKLRWTEGSNLRIEVRWSADPALAARHAADLVALGAEVLVGEAHTHHALRRQTHTIPIVFVGVTDPIGQGLVASLSHPGGDITGFSIFDAPMAGKWLGMLTQITPPVARVAVLFDPATTTSADLMLPACAGNIDRTQLFARELVQLVPDVLVAVTTPGALGDAMRRREFIATFAGAAAWSLAAKTIGIVCVSRCNAAVATIRRPPRTRNIIWTHSYPALRHFRSSRSTPLSTAWLPLKR
jgi:hypothetical protein